MNKDQHQALLSAYDQDKNNLVKYQKIYKYAYILSDGIFKIVFTQDKEHTLLISLVNAMLDLQGDQAIKSITLEMQEFPGAFDKKNCILDIIGTTNANEKVLVEIQQKSAAFFRDRVEYYVSRVIENQVHKSESYELPRIYFLGLLDFVLFPEEPAKYLHHVEEMCNGRLFFPKIQKVFVELQKFFELDDAGLVCMDESDAAKWLRAIKSTIQEKPMPEALVKNPIFVKLQNEMKLCNFGDELFNLEVHRMNDLKFERECGFADGRETGLLEGKELGRAEGEKLGRAEGEKLGRAEAQRISVIKALKRGKLTPEEIAEDNEMSLEDILKIQKSMAN